MTVKKKLSYKGELLLPEYSDEEFVRTLTLLLQDLRQSGAPNDVFPTWIGLYNKKLSLSCEWEVETYV